MWPGIEATEWCRFLTAYKSVLIGSSRVNAVQLPMPAEIANSLGAESGAFLMQGVAGAVSITIPLVILVLIFQKQIVSGLTQGAVKG